MSDHRTDGPLADVRVVEFSQNAAVPQCGRLLAGMGADVIKVEPPSGDAMRHLASLTELESRAFATINPGKRAIVVDFADEASTPVIERLVCWADIVLIGLKRSDFVRYGLDWATIHAINPRVVSLEFTAYGPNGPMAEAPGYDPLVQAASGLGWLMNRSADDVPLTTRPAFIDFSSGTTAAAAVLAALRHAERTGEGQRVDASLLGNALSLGTPMFSSFAPDRERAAELAEELNLLRAAGVGFDELRRHYAGTVVAPSGLFRLYVRAYRTADGIVSIAGYSPTLIARLNELLELEPIDQSTSHDEIEARVASAEQRFAERTTDDWVNDLERIGYPYARFNTPHEALADEQVEANDYVVDLHHPRYGDHRVVGMPFSFSATPVGIDAAAPSLGEHTVEVLTELGFSAAEMSALGQ